MRKNQTAALSPHLQLFAHSNFGLDTLQCRIFTLLLEHLPESGPLPPLRIKLEEALGPNPSHYHYTLLEDALDDLSGKRLRHPGEQRYSATYVPVFDYLAFSQEQEGIITALFSERVQDVLRELTSTFTLQEIGKFLMLRHSHTQRFFWFLRVYAGRGKLDISIDELKDVVLGVRKYRHKDAEYERYYDFKTRVVDQAIKAIRDKGLLDIRYRELRHKRVVEKLSIRVNFCYAPPAQDKSQQLVLF